MNWLIKLLGGYAAERSVSTTASILGAPPKNAIDYERELKEFWEAQKNDHRDGQGRYTKEGE